jgi:hypothetical protein
VASAVSCFETPTYFKGHDFFRQLLDSAGIGGHVVEKDQRRLAEIAHRSLGNWF